MVETGRFVTYFTLTRGLARAGATMVKLQRSAGARRSKPKETGTVDYQVGEKLRDLRNDRNLSQRALGEMIGVTFQQVQKYEKGTNRITVARLDEICKALGVSYDFFLSAQANSAGGLADGHAQSSLGPPLTSDESTLLSAFRRVSSVRKRRTILELVQEMSDERGGGGRN